MKKNLKKFIALLVSVMMVLAVAVVANATENNSGSTPAEDTAGSYTLTINSPANNKYALYQIATFDTFILNDATVYRNIEVKDRYKDDFKPYTVAMHTDDDGYMQSLAIKLAAIEEEPIKTDITNSVSGIVPGYYLLKETEHDKNDSRLVTKYFLLAIDGDKTITLKISEPTIEKKIVLENSVETNVADTAAGTLVDSNVAAFGDEITYQIKSTIPNYPSNATDIQYVITDTLSKGLDFVEGTVAVKLETDTTLEKAGDNATEATNLFTVKKDVKTVGTTITITMNPEKVQEHSNKAVFVTLRAKLKDTASVGATGNPNTVTLTYENSWDTSSTYTTPEDTVITYTGVLSIEKVDQANTGTKLEGAKFAVYSKKDYRKPNNNDKAEDTITVREGEADKTYYYYDTVTTGKDGVASISGLDAGTYYAVETTAPEDYILDPTPQPIVLTVEQSALGLETGGNRLTTVGNDEASKVYSAEWKNNGSDKAQIKNKKGLTLPGTGGIGTTLFTFGGLALVVLAAVLFIVYTRKQKKNS